MNVSIEEAIERVLLFLQDVPLSDNTIKSYCWHYRSIKKYCDEKGIKEFSHEEALIFTEYQMGRYMNGDIGLSSIQRKNRERK
jgi:site-specific recombinase XerD